jgi:predicted porin
MNNTIKLAVASALIAAASTASAAGGIVAGDWTLDIGGNVNAFASTTNAKVTQGTAPVGGLAGVRDAQGEKTANGINTGLLPSWIGFSGKTRQNDLDVDFTISLQPNVSDNGAAGDANTPLNRQAFVSFGDKSWGSIKLGKDLGIFAADAILNDMTLLGVGGASGNSGTATTLGGIGSGYIYAAWKGQVAYTSPNFNGFSFTAGITNPNQGFGAANQDRFGFEGKASYAFTGDVSGKVWASAASYDVTTSVTPAVAGSAAVVASGVAGTTTYVLAAPAVLGAAAIPSASYKANAFDIGATVSAAGFGLTGYYYNGEGAGTTVFGGNGATAAGAKRDSDGGYVQATYALPGVGTKLGVAYGVSKLDLAAGETNNTLVSKNERITVGAYHPITKHLNLVAEYNNVQSEAQVKTNKTESNAVSLGAILFF